jgi:CheY-like chemotaxis protein
MRLQGIVRVLVLEDDPVWRQALAEMYGAILGPRGRVTAARDGAAAERLLHKHPTDVLSLDLNLSQGTSGGAGGPLRCDSGRLQLIELAARNRWARSIVLITRADTDAQSRFVTCDEGRLNEATVSPDEFIRRRFDDRGLVLNKPARWDLQACIAHFEPLIRRRLPDLARTRYTLRFGGTVHDPRVSIEAERRPIAALIGNDAMLLSALATLARAGELLGDKSVVEIYRGRAGGDASDPQSTTRIAQREIDGLRRRLRNHGVDDRALLHRVRKSDTTGASNPGGAWRIDGSVLTEGMSSIRTRGRGGSDFRTDVPNTAAE